LFDGLLRFRSYGIDRLLNERSNFFRLRQIDRVPPAASTKAVPARFDISRCASGGIILSSVAARYQLGLVFHVGVVIAP
jgi:hypothetical protein